VECFHPTHSVAVSWRSERYGLAIGAEDVEAACATIGLRFEWPKVIEQREMALGTRSLKTSPRYCGKKARNEACSLI